MSDLPAQRKRVHRRVHRRISHRVSIETVSDEPDPIE